ncbi:MAG: bifunctional riboflavin kinase/FAD synthetase [bacterium]
MELIRGLHNLKPGHRGCVATIGNFDGVHLGHQAVFRALREKAAFMGLPSVVILFEPQPIEFFQAGQTPARLTRLRDKLDIIRELGVDRVLLLKFDKKLASLMPADFIEQILVQKLAIEHLYVGDDFQFGKGRAGDFALLQATGRNSGFTVASLETVLEGKERISSTRIRLSLSNGELSTAAECLGRPFTICGRVGHGDKRGRQLNFPTINIDLHRRVTPILGVFAVQVSGLADEPLPGVANVGNRPTFDNDARYLLEVHLLDFEGDVYGEQVKVEFVERIRSEMKFDSLDKLTKRIQMDADIAREVLGVEKAEGVSYLLPDSDSDLI